MNNFRSLKECKIFVHKLGLTTAVQWREFAQTDKRPEDIPSCPDVVFKGRNWKGWKDWLGTAFYSYAKAKMVLKDMNILNGLVFKEQVHILFPRPSKMPIHPEIHYEKEWEGWTKFLGQRRVRTRHKGTPTPPKPFKKATHFRPFLEAVKFVSTQNLRDRPHYIEWLKTYPYSDLPYKPDEVYAEWDGWSLWLGHNAARAIMVETSVFYVGRRVTDPGNVYLIGIEAGGKSALVHKARAEGFQIVRMWKYDPTLREEVRQTVAANANSYGNGEEYIIPNIHGLFGDMFNVLVVLS